MANRTWRPNWAKLWPLSRTARCTRWQPFISIIDRWRPAARRPCLESARAPRPRRPVDRRKSIHLASWPARGAPVWPPPSLRLPACLPDQRLGLVGAAPARPWGSVQLAGRGRPAGRLIAMLRLLLARRLLVGRPPSSLPGDNKQAWPAPANEPRECFTRPPRSPARFPLLLLH